MLRRLAITLTILTPSERRRGALVVALMLGAALIEVAGIASIAPFLAVLGNPEVVETNSYLARAYAALGFESPRAFLFALGLLALVVLVGTSVFRAGVTYAVTRYTSMRRHAIGRRLLEGHLRQPYAFFLQRNSVDLSKTIFSEVDQFIGSALRPLAELVTYGAVTVAIVVLLLIVDPVLALGVAALIGGFYGLVYGMARRWLDRIGRDRARANRERFKAAAEALGGIKELKLLGREAAYLRGFEAASRRLARHVANSAIVGALPRFLMEAIGFAAVLLLALYLIADSGDLGAVLPVLGLYVFAGYRLLPAAQRIYGAVTSLRFGAAAVDAVVADLNQLPPAPAGAERGERLPIAHAIELRDVSFAYPGARDPVLRDVSLTLPANATVGFVGATGAGKSTLIDLILGLLEPSEGRVLVDGTPLGPETVRAWQRGIGYVPQHIFLADDTVARNIAFGVADGALDREAVERAARMAQLHDFITDELPHGYDTVIGERGVRLSGGQRQRLGIARALYHDPQLLVLDEATNALDQETEAAVMRAIEDLSGQKTILMIAHRLETLQRCDMVVRLEGGAVRDVGSYEAVLGLREVSRARTGTDLDPR